MSVLSNTYSDFSDNRSMSSKIKKQVRFKIYNAKNLETIKKLREDKEKDLENMEKERD